MYTYGGFLLRFDRKQQNSIKQLSFNLKKILKKRSRLGEKTMGIPNCELDVGV